MMKTLCYRIKIARKRFEQQMKRNAKKLMRKERKRIENLAQRKFLTRFAIYFGNIDAHLLRCSFQLSISDHCKQRRQVRWMRN